MPRLKSFSNISVPRGLSNEQYNDYFGDEEFYDYDDYSDLEPELDFTNIDKYKLSEEDIEDSLLKKEEQEQDRNKRRIKRIEQRYYDEFDNY